MTSFVYLLFFVSSLGFLASIGLAGTRLYLLDILVGFGSILFILRRLLLKERILLRGFQLFNLVFIGIGFISWVWGSYLLSEGEMLASIFYLVRYLAYFLLSVVVLNSLTPSHLKPIFNFFLFSAILFALGGFIQLLVLPDFTVLPTELGWDPHQNRLASTFFDPNFAGGYLVLSFITAVPFFYPATPAGVATGALLLLSLVLTFSRSTWLMFAVCVFFLGVFKYRKLLVLTFLIVFLAYYLVPRVQTRISGITDPADSAAYRLTSWKNALTVFEESNYIGVGFNTFRYAQRELGAFDYRNPDGGNAGGGADSSLLLVLATTGIPGLLAYTLYLLSLILGLFKKFLKTKNSAYLVVGTGVVSLLIHSQFVNSLFYPQILLWLAVIPSVALIED